MTDFLKRYVDASLKGNLSCLINQDLKETHGDLRYAEKSGELLVLFRALAEEYTRVSKILEENRQIISF